jgi:uncharacterized protein (TIGR03000 family)
MNRSSDYFVYALFLALGLCVFQFCRSGRPALPFQNLAEALGGAGWREYQPPGGGFAVSMPAEPEVKTETIQLFWATVPLRLHTARAGEAAYTVASADIPPALVEAQGTDAALAACRDGSVRGARGSLLSDAPASLQGFPGREVKFSTAGGKGIVHFRVYLVGGRLYMVSCAAVAGADDRDVARFFGSFQLLPAGPDPCPATAPGPTADRTVRLTVQAPPDARVAVEGVPTAGSGAVRRFRSPPLEPGREYTYSLTAEWSENGRPVTRTQQVTVRVGQQALVNFLDQ